MESKALSRLQQDVERLLAQLDEAAQRQVRLTEELGKGGEEIERLRDEIRRYEDERKETRRKLDALLDRFEKLDINWDGIS